MDAKYGGIHLKPSDNGGFVLSFHTYQPHIKKSHSMYKEHTETFSASEQETALGRVSELYKDNLDHYKKAMSGKKKNKSSHSSHNSPTPVY